MKNRETQRAVKNILHNELGITSEKVETLITEYIDNKLNKKIDDYLNSNSFKCSVSKQVRDLSHDIIRYTLKGQLQGLQINVSLNPNNDTESV